MKISAIGATTKVNVSHRLASRRAVVAGGGGGACICPLAFGLVEFHAC